MKNDFLPQSLHIAAFALNQEHHAGSEKLRHFVRLLEETRNQNPETLVTYNVQGEMRENSAGQPTPWLTLSAQTNLNLVCQRCLTAVELPVAFERNFRFVANEALAAIEDEESEEDVLVLSKNFDLLSLIEDELLLAMPLVAKHATCPVAVKSQVADADFQDSSSEKPNPFAALQQLKNKP
jgi:uncharacterized protein